MSFKIFKNRNDIQNLPSEFFEGERKVSHTCSYFFFIHVLLKHDMFVIQFLQRRNTGCSIQVECLPVNRDFRGREKGGYSCDAVGEKGVDGNFEFRAGREGEFTKGIFTSIRQRFL
jgi:hypothetical protein